MMRNLLFIHGAGNEGRVWKNIKDELSSIYNIYTPDLPGHGKEGGLCTTIDEYAKFIHDYIEKNKLKNVILIGHSMGGAIAIKSALFDRAAALVVVDSGLKLPVNQKLLTKLKESPEEAIKIIAKWSFAPSAQESLVNSAVEMMLHNKNIILNDFAVCSAYEAYSAAEKIKKPSVVIVGDSDVMTPFELAEATAVHLRAKVVKIENAGHMLPIENPKMLSTKIDEFVRSI